MLPGPLECSNTSGAGTQCARVQDDIELGRLQSSDRGMYRVLWTTSCWSGYRFKYVMASESGIPRTQLRLRNCSRRARGLLTCYAQNTSDITGNTGSESKMSKLISLSIAAAHRSGLFDGRRMPTQQSASELRCS